jgi:DNA-binding NtrC family response regulator
MKIALIVESDPEIASNLQTQLKLLGYVAFIATTPARALNVVKVCKINLILISTPTRMHERRSLAGELKSILPTATVVLITTCDVTYFQARSLRYSGLSAVLRGPPTLTALWRALESVQYGLGCHPGWVVSAAERRAPL